MNVLHRFECIDDTRTGGTQRPDGSWMAVYALRLRTDFEPEHHAFRLERWYRQ